MTKDLSHLNALEGRLSHEREYLRKERSQDGRALRKVWIAQIEKEIADELKFLGIEEIGECNLTDDELLAELTAA